MSNIVVLLFPIFANLFAVYLIVFKRRRALVTTLITNLIFSILFGFFISIKVLCCSSDSAWWLMPLVFAPLEYWARFGIAIIVLAVIMALWSKYKANRRLS